MNKEKLMQFLSDAIDKGARIDVLIHGNGHTKEQAETVCNRFSEIVGGKIEEINSGDLIWYKVKTEQISLDHFHNISHKHSHFMQEDVDLGGMSDAI